MVPHPAHHPGHGHPASASWCSPFGSKPVPSHHNSPPGMGVANASSHSSPHLFSFPPTPPKDATPDNVSGSASTANGNAQSGNPSGSEFGSASTGSQSSTSSTAGGQLAGNSVVSSDTLSTSAGAAELKPYYVNAATHHNMITSLGSALTNCSSSKPREGTGANFSSSINQSAHTYHSSSISPYYPAHYVGSSAGPPMSGSVSEFSASSPYGFPHHSHHSASSLLSAKSIQSSGQSNNKQRTKGRSSAGKRTNLTREQLSFATPMAMAPLRPWPPLSDTVFHCHTDSDHLLYH